MIASSKVPVVHGEASPAPMAIWQHYAANGIEATREMIKRTMAEIEAYQPPTHADPL